MKSRVIAYWVCTGLIVFSFLTGGVAQVIRQPQTFDGITQLGYPGYFVVLLGLWKIFGALAVAVPRFPLVKEWAYAGMIFDLTGASVSHFESSSGVRHVLVPLVIAGLVVASWALRPESRRLKRA